MKRITNSQRKNNIVKNLNFLMEEHGETKTSFSQKTGLTRATIYKILEGKVSNAQHSTVNRISDFFGVSCETIENTDLKKIKVSEETLSFEGNKNPISVPVIPLSSLRHNLSKPIGELVQIFNTTHYFGTGGNFIALLIDTCMGGGFETGTLLIVNRSPYKKNLQPSLYIDDHNTLHIRDMTSKGNNKNRHELYVGILIEEMCQ